MGTLMDKHQNIFFLTFPHRALNNYMNSLDHSTNYFGTVVSVIKQVMRETKDIDKQHQNTEFLSSHFKTTSQDVDSIYLTVDELERIHKKEIAAEFAEMFYPRSEGAVRQSVIKSYNIVKNRFLLGAFTGLRMSDFNNIDLDNMRNGVEV